MIKINIEATNGENMGSLVTLFSSYVNSIIWSDDYSSLKMEMTESDFINFNIDSQLAELDIKSMFTFAKAINAFHGIIVASLNSSIDKNSIDLATKMLKLPYSNIFKILCTAIENKTVYAYITNDWLVLEDYIYILLKNLCEEKEVISCTPEVLHAIDLYLEFSNDKYGDYNKQTMLFNLIKFGMAQSDLFRHVAFVTGMGVPELVQDMSKHSGKTLFTYSRETAEYIKSEYGYDINCIEVVPNMLEEISTSSIYYHIQRVEESSGPFYYSFDHYIEHPDPKMCIKSVYDRLKQNDPFYTPLHIKQYKEVGKPNISEGIISMFLDNKEKYPMHINTLKHAELI